MTWSEDQIICIKHPKEIPQPGVCPSCLRERLSIIATCQHSTTINPSLSSESGSPHRKNRMHQRVASDVLDSIYLAVKRHDLGLKKSRSIAFADDGAVDHGRVVVHNEKKKRRFWDKVLLRSRVRKTKI